MRKVSILGSTGSIGKNTIDIIRQHPDKFCVETLTAHKNYQLLAHQAREFKAKTVVIGDENFYTDLKQELSDTSIEILSGEEGLIAAASAPVDVVMSALTGIAGLMPTYTALSHSKIVAIANKESIVAAGSLMKVEAARHNCQIMPTDSEHNAIFQVLQESHHSYLNKVTLTASGGPFRELAKAEFETITVAQALAHPNWSMGYKNSIDSATLANKGLELIEASYLFDVPENQLDVLIHPQSIVHSLISFHDGSTLAQLSTPDMRTPISYALSWPERVRTNVAPLDLIALKKLDFSAPDEDRFPALALARQALCQGAFSVIAFNAANEIAVNAFVQNSISFVQIPEVIEECMTLMPRLSITTIADVLNANGQALRQAQHIIKRKFEK